MGKQSCITTTPTTTKRFHYKSVCEALHPQGHAVLEVAVVVICVRGSVPTTTSKTTHKLLGIVTKYFSTAATAVLRYQTVRHYSTNDSTFRTKLQY
jgi:hypothetical protein